MYTLGLYYRSCLCILTAHLLFCSLLEKEVTNKGDTQSGIYRGIDSPKHDKGVGRAKHNILEL